jgi:uncharacterized coiled-coil protein SlyX
MRCGTPGTLTQRPLQWLIVAELYLLYGANRLIRDRWAMKLVSEQSDAEIARRRALDQLGMHLRALTANLMRVSRGAGAPHYIADQMVACLEAMEAYRSAATHGVSAFDFQGMLDPLKVNERYNPHVGGTEEDWARWSADGTFDMESAVDDIRRASLQLTASMLVDQVMHVRRAETDLYEGVRRLEAAREKSRAHRENAMKPPRKPRR